MNDQAARQLAKNAEKVKALLWQYPEGIALAEITSKTMMSAPAAKEALKTLGAVLCNGFDYVLPEQPTEPSTEPSATQDKVLKLLLEYKYVGVTAITVCSALGIDDKTFKNALNNIRGRFMKVDAIKKEGETGAYYYVRPDKPAGNRAGNKPAVATTEQKAPPAEQKKPTVESPLESLECVDPSDNQAVKTSSENVVEVKKGVFMMQPSAPESEVQPKTEDAPNELKQERLPDGGWAFMAATTGERISRVWPSSTEAIEQMERETGQKLEEITAMNRAYLAKFKAVITYKPIFVLGLGEV